MKKQIQKSAPAFKNTKPKSKDLIYYIILFVTAFVFYGNTISNDFVLDDLIVITGNQFTQKGFEGLKDIFTHDAFVGAYGEALNLTGGRYRPLSIASFAVEKELFGYSPQVFHFFNVLFFALTAVLLYYVLRKLLKTQNEFIPFAAALLFTIHPIHTEVVANIKSRDEIYVLFFGLIVFLLMMRKELWAKISAPVIFFLALLSKENAITFLLLIPLAIYLFTEEKIKSVLIRTLPLLLIALVYIYMRATFAGIVGDRFTTDIMDDSYLHATLMQKLATITQIQLHYVGLLIFPYQLSYDYSFNQLPLVSWTNWQAITSLLFHLGLMVIAILSFQKNKIISYSIIFYFATFSLVSNLVFNIGTSMAERFAYLPSVGFCLALAWFISKMLKLDLQSGFVIPKNAFIILAIISVIAAIKTISRNKDWQDNYSLYKADVDKVPNSARSQLYYGIESISQYTHGNPDINLINEAIKHIRISCGINPDFHYAFHNLGVAYQTINKWQESVGCYKRVLQLMPDNEQALYGLGLAYGKGLNQPDKAMPYFKKLVYGLKKDNADYWESLGLCYAVKQDYGNALNYFHQGIEKNPDAAKLYYNVGITFANLGVKDSADYYMNKATGMDASLKR